MKLEGSIVALVTPMKLDGSVDWSALDGLLEWHLNCGTRSVNQPENAKSKKHRRNQYHVLFAVEKLFDNADLKLLDCQFPVRTNLLNGRRNFFQQGREAFGGNDRCLRKKEIQILEK